jgi:protein-tyrosine phosphatase
MEPFTDLHCHILPGIDDGSPDSEVSQAMLTMACECGTSELFATPHLISGGWQPAWQDICRLCAELNHTAARQHWAIRVHPGAEVAMDWSLLELLPGPGDYCLAGGRFILVELPLGSLPTYADDFLFTLQARDFLPILAHPERNPDVKKNPRLLERWLDGGVYAQINAASLTGTMGSRTQAAAEALLAYGGVHFIGSDAHGVGVRRPDLQPVAERLIDLLGPAGARLLLSDNSRQLLADCPEAIVAPKSILRPQPQRSWRQKVRALWQTTTS